MYIAKKKIFFYLPLCLIINFERKNHIFNKIIFSEELDLSFLEGGLSKILIKKYFLIGIIKNLNGHYISIIFDYIKENKWILFDDNKTTVLKNFKEHDSGNVEMLFYVDRDKMKKI